LSQKRRKHHYVPVWYQWRFLPNRQTPFYYLNLNPYKTLADGRQIKLKELYNWGPGNCFFRKDLCTTRAFGRRNEAIEEFLFGKIDDDGAKAINALVVQDFDLLSKLFLCVFEYMDAQILRTPKGLDWIRSNYFQLSHIELMLEMQQLRTMHCTMWTEGVMEIVSAEDSDVKFIVSDHPVTIYNPAFPPESKICMYPNDPPTAWLASQTVFPLDSDHCFVLTNLEYAHDPSGVNPRMNRTNPRYFANTITRWDSIIRTRKLKADEVCIFNYIIKMRARKYIASSNYEWLYPENNLTNKNWEELGQVLLPPKNELWNFGGEIYVGGKNGELLWYQDEFGRRFSSRDSKEDPVRKYTIKRRNQILFNAILDIFEFNKGKEWDDFRREITDKKVSELYKVVGSLWNPDTEIMSILPTPDNKISAFYSGTTDPRIIPITIMGYSLYVDRILMLSPFLNPRVMKEEHSPVNSPSQYIYETIKNVLLMMQIMPLIEADVVEMIPDPCDFDFSLRKRTFGMAEARLKGRGPKPEEMKQTFNLMRDDIMRFLLSLTPDHLRNYLRKAIPNLSNEDLEKILKYISTLKLKDPLAPLHNSTSGKEERQLQISHMGGNLEIALFIAQFTGSYLYTDNGFRWKEIQSAILKKQNEHDEDPWQPLAGKLNGFPFEIYLVEDPNFFIHIREHRFFRDFRKLLRDSCISIRKIRKTEDASIMAKELAEVLMAMDSNSELNTIDKEYNKWSGNQDSIIALNRIKSRISHIIPRNGFSLNTVTQLLLTHGFRSEYFDSVPMAAFIDMERLMPLERDDQVK